jgi:hypothetical protein
MAVAYEIGTVGAVNVNTQIRGDLPKKLFRFGLKETECSYPILSSHLRPVARNGR